jgi:hypothetical protein
MKKIINLKNFISNNLDISYFPDSDSITVGYSDKGGTIFLDGGFQKDEKIKWNDSQYIVFDVIS